MIPAATQIGYAAGLLLLLPLVALLDRRRLGGWTAVTLWGAATAIFVIALRLIKRL